MKNTVILFAFLLAGFVSCQQGANTKQQEIVLTNTSSVDLIDKAISIKRAELPPEIKADLLPLVMSHDGDTIPAQLDDLDGDNQWDELFFVVNIPANGEKTVLVNWVSSLPNFQKRTSARFGKRASKTSPVEPATSEILTAKEMPKSLGYQRYQTDGPSWENDKVAFRDYLDGRNAKDLFGKKISAMSPENVGINAQGAVEDNYHVMEDWGRDILSVGNSVGIGGYALMVGNELMRLGVTVDDSVNNVEETAFSIMAEGPVRSVLHYKYSNWKPDNRTYSVVENTSIWPGMYAYQNSVKVTGLQGDENLAIGLVNINTEMPLTELEGNDKYVVLYTHDKQTYDKTWWLGLALILPRDLYLGFTEAPKMGKLSNTFLAKLKIGNDKPVKYFAVGCWELSDEGFVDPVYFKDYLQNLTSQLSAEVKVTVR